ncbi:MAG: transglycosylase domain-containing protein, partial [Pseudomonadota bacterium]
GGSTISQQTAKNVFLWPDRSWLRKGLEAGFTILIEVTWPKRRILEVYLNVAEFDEGVFGAEAAAWHYFNRPAAELSLTQAARLAAILPDPKGRSAARPGAWTQRRARQIASGAETLRQDGRAACITP